MCSSVASICLHRCVSGFVNVCTYISSSVHVKDCPNCRQRKCETLRVALPQNVLQSIIHPKQCTLLFILTQTTVQNKKWLHAKESHIKWDSESYCSFSENYFVCCCSNRALGNVYNRPFVELQNHKYFQQGLKRYVLSKKVS